MLLKCSANPSAPEGFAGIGTSATSTGLFNLPSIPPVSEPNPLSGISGNIASLPSVACIIPELLPTEATEGTVTLPQMQVDNVVDTTTLISTPMISSSASTTELHVSMPQLPEVSAAELPIQPISTINLQADRVVEALTTSSAGSVAASVRQ